MEGQATTSRAPAASTGATFTIEEALTHIGFGKSQILMFIFVGIAWAGDGMEAMLLSYLGPELRCKWNLSPAQESWITSAVFIGMMLGSYTWGSISDRYGRKVGYFAPAAFTAIFGILSALSPNYGAMLFFRACVGFGIAGDHVAYTLLMEYVAPEHRGQIMSLIEGFWTLGAIVLAAMAWLILPIMSWRILVLVAAVPLFLLIAVYPLLKESPHWLLANDFQEEAMAGLEWAARFNGKELPPGTLIHHPHQSHEAQSSTVPEHAAVHLHNGNGDVGASAGRKTERLGPIEHLQRLATAVVDSVNQMFFNGELATTSSLLSFVWVGVAMAYYGIILLGVEVFSSSNDVCTDDNSAKISSNDFKDVFITSLGEIAGLIVCMLLIDYWGRRRCLYVFMMLTAVFMAPLLRQQGPETSSPTSLLDVASVFATRMFAYAAYVVLFIYTPEIYPTKIRSFAFGVFNALSRLGGLASPFVAVALAQEAGIETAAGVLLGVSALAGILSFFLPIETMGRSLPEDTEDVHDNAVSAPPVKRRIQDGVAAPLLSEQAHGYVDSAPLLPEQAHEYGGPAPLLQNAREWSVPGTETPVDTDTVDDLDARSEESPGGDDSS